MTNDPRDPYFRALSALAAEFEQQINELVVMGATIEDMDRMVRHVNEATSMSGADAGMLAREVFATARSRLAAGEPIFQERYR